MVNDDRPTMQPHLADLLTLFSLNTELVVADSSSTMSTWFSIVFRSTLNTLCDTQCKGAPGQVSHVEALHLLELEALFLTLEPSTIVFVVHPEKILHELDHTRTAINVGRVTILSTNVYSFQIYKRYLRSPSAPRCAKVRRISLCSLGVAHPFHRLLTRL